MNSNFKLAAGYLAQTSSSPLNIEVSKAKGVYLWDKDDRRYIDLISGVCVNNLGHAHPAITKAIKKQIDNYSHVMVYGEILQEPQSKYAELLAKNLPENLNCTYFVNSGTEAVEGALKLAKRYSGKTKIIAFKNSYHGSTHGSLSVMGNEEYKNSFRPLLPDICFLEFNNTYDLKQITNNTAAVIIEPIQGESGVLPAQRKFLEKLKDRCLEKKTLLIFDEVQTGFGRTGSLFAFQQYGVIPDVLVLAKALGGSMPLGAFISSKKIMDTLTNNPALGHITTFGGHPVCCAAGYASLQTLLKSKIISKVKTKEKLFLSLLKHPLIQNVRSMGLMIALEFENVIVCNNLIKECINNGVIVDSFLHAPNALRIAPPLIISEKEIRDSSNILVKSMNVIIN